MEGFMLILLSSILIEAVINIITNVKEEETSWKYWASLGLGLVLGVAVAVNWNIDFFSLVGFPPGRIPYLGAVLTGLIISRGSNYVSDLVGLVKQ